ncbi:hypothetical protein ACHAWF_007941 [Thalassiosira exigua]
MSIYTGRADSGYTNYSGEIPHDVPPADILSIRRMERNTLEYFTAENWRKVGATLCQSRVLTHLDFSGCALTKEDVEALIAGCGSCSWPSLKAVNLSDNNGYGVLKAFHPMLKSMSALDTLVLERCNLGVNGAKLVADVLNHAKINNLHLSGNNLNDQGLESILSARNARHLVKFFVNGVKYSDRGSKFSDRGYEAMTQLLREATQLKMLSFDGPLNASQTKLMVDRISRDSMLEAITLFGRYASLPAELNDHFLNLVCNTSNVSTLCSSNHHFSGFKVRSFGSPYSGFDEKEFPKLSLALDINVQSASSDEAIRRKMRNFYFENEFDVKSFNEMDAALMPYILDLAMMTEVQSSGWTRRESKPRLVPNENLSSLYRLLRNCHLSELFSFPSPETLLQQKDERIRQLEVESEILNQRLQQINHEGEQRASTCKTHPFQQTCQNG